MSEPDPMTKCERRIKKIETQIKLIGTIGQITPITLEECVAFMLQGRWRETDILEWIKHVWPKIGTEEEPYTFVTRLRAYERARTGTMPPEEQARVRRIMRLVGMSQESERERTA